MREEIFENERELRDILFSLSSDADPIDFSGTYNQAIQNAKQLNLIKQSDFEKAKEAWEKIKDEPYAMDNTIYVAQRIAVMLNYIDQLEKRSKKIPLPYVEEK